jgi:DNA invertase Pin-like site-specific DNA recombinase
MSAYGYIRKSVVHDPARMLSPEMQEAAIRKLAAANGDAEVVILSDLDVSGRKRRDRRPGWNELLHAVEDGEATAVYAYSLSRFARSVSQLAEFFDLCDRLKVRVRVDRDQIDTSTATGKLVGNVLASLAQFEADVASERVKDAFATKRVRDPEWQGPGNRPYGEGMGEDVAAVVAAFHEAGSFDGAARLLNDRGVVSRYQHTGSHWFGSAVAAIVRRVAPDEVLPAVHRGAPAGSHNFRLARLLACGTCGTFLTPSKDTKYDYIRYYCHRARVVAHPRKWVTERVVLPGVAAEVEHAALMIKRMQKGSRADEASLAALAAKRTRVIDTYTDGLIDKAERDARLATIADAESKLATRRMVRRITIPPVIMDTTDEDGVVVKGDDPAKVNSYLRRLLVRVVVDMSEPGKKGPSKSIPAMKFEWRDPTLRGEVVEEDDGPGNVEAIVVVGRRRRGTPAS